jgi:AcrR family transcriptional regulator
MTSKPDQPEPSRAAQRDTGADALRIRPPLQQRSREAWTRVLDAGVSLLEQGGYEAFTIAAVCKRANVAPRAIYDRAASKDALFLAVYEHGIQRVRDENKKFTDDTRWRGLTAPELLGRAVRELAGIFHRHAAFLRPVMLISGMHPEIYRRGTRYSREVGDQFTTLLLRAHKQIDQPDPTAASYALFNTVFSALVLRTMYGPGFAAPADDDETFITALSTMACRYLLVTAVPDADDAATTA